MADGAGNAVLDSNGQPIVLSPTDTQITIAGDGTVSSENGQLGKIGVVRPTDPMKLAAEGNTLFRADTPTTPVTSPGLVQGVDRGLQRPAGAGGDADDGRPAAVPVRQPD